MREIHRRYLVNPSYRPFDERGLAAATKKEGSSTTGSWRADRAPTQPSEGAQLIAFLMELFNLSVAGVDIPAIWISKAGKPREHGRSYHPISLLCQAAKVLERLLLPNIVEALCTCPSQLGFKPMHSTTSALLPMSASLVSDFNQRKST